MNDERREANKSLGEGLAWSSRIMTGCIMMALPMGAGVWLDDKWEISPALTIVGMLFGVVGGIFYLIQITQEKKKDE